MKDVSGVVEARTGHALRLPKTKLEQQDVDGYVASLLNRPLTANSAARVALLKSRRIRAALEDLNLSQADFLEASQPANPTLFSKTRWPNSGSGNNIELELAGDVLNWLLLPLRQTMALHEYEAAKRRLSHEMLDFVFEVKQAYYEAQGQQELTAKWQTALEVNHVSSEVAQRLRQAGNITALELLQEQTTAQQVEVELRKTRGAYAAAREKLNRLIGLTSSESARWSLAGKLSPPPASDPRQSRMEALAIAQRQDFAAQRETVAALEMGFSLTRKMRYFPAVNLGVNTEHDLDGTRVTGPSLDLELPIFNQGQARVRRSSAELNKAHATYEALDLEVRSDVRTALLRMQNARAIYEHLSTDLLPKRQQILAQTLLQYNAMQVSSIVLLRAKEDEVNSQRDAVEALRDYWIARAELEKAVGGSLTAKPTTSPRP